jgi:hypothetical protein
VSFAEGTTVPVERSRAEIEATVTRYGATRFASGWDGDKAAINFVARGRLVRFVLPLPTRETVLAALKKTDRYRWRTPAEGVITDALAKELRRRWRCLLLAIKSKLEIVETGIETFEQAFLANIVTAGNLTIYERITLADSPVKMLAAAEEVKMLAAAEDS